MKGRSVAILVINLQILTLFHCFEKKNVDVLQVTLRRKIWLLLSCDHKLIVLLKLAT